MTNPEQRQRRIEANPEYPEDYGDWLDECMGQEGPSISYEDWKSKKLAITRDIR